MRQAFALSICIGVVWGAAAATAQPMTRQARACFAWDKELHRMLNSSEQFSIHAPELRQSIRFEAGRLRERCIRDISMASLSRYVMLMKMLYDDEADEVESFD